MQNSLRDQSSRRFLGRRGVDGMSLPVVVLATLSLISLALEFGFDQPPLPHWVLTGVQGLAVVAYVVSRVLGLVRARAASVRLGGLRLDLACLVALVLAYLFVEVDYANRPAIKMTAFYVAVMQAVLLVRLAIGGFKLNLALSKSRLHPARSLVITFVGLIVLGGLALSLPKATSAELHSREGFTVAKHMLNCLFTATSATCVTGLVVYDTATDFTPFGQVIILILIQAGGLGIMIFGSLFGLLAGQQLSLKYSLALQDAISYRTLGRLRTMVVFIFLTTFLVEGIGAVGLYTMSEGATVDRLLFSLFHAISAFCNAGFALQSDSLIAYSGAWQVYGVIMPLIVVGGLGFPVLYDGGRVLRHRIWSKSRRYQENTSLVRLSLHSRMVLLTTFLLIVVTVPAYVLFERGADGSVVGRFADALFYSVTCRTAGFNTVDMGEGGLTPATHMLGVLLMFVGGSPASTAGGVKTVALAVLLLGVWSTMRGRDRVEFMGRTIPETVVRRAAVVVVVMFAAVSFLTLVICMTEDVSLRVALFESASACGTVGLSTGLTPELTIPGRVAIMTAMLAGRLGPLTLLIALAGRGESARYEYPEEQVGIG